VGLAGPPLKRTLHWLAAVVLLSCSVSSRDEPPNIVLIISDDQAWTDYGFMGHEYIQTPNIDRLARESLTFTRGHVPVSMCRPSLSTIVTGLYPHQHRIVGNDPLPPEELRGEPNSVQRRDPRYLQWRSDYVAHIDRVPALAGMLAEAGYLSHQSGKWWEGHFRRGGFTHGMTHGDPARGGRHGDAGLSIGRQGLKPIFEFIRGAREESKPFFVYYAPFMPHTPHNPPERLLEKYMGETPHAAIASYWAMCEWLDETCGQLLDYVDQKGLRDNTVVLYVCDNGWIQLPNSGGSDPRSKRSRFEGGVRTPIMVRWPGKAKPRRDEQHLASSIDLAPTILAAAGLEPTKDMQGVNLLDDKAVAARETIFGAVYTHDAADIHDPASSLMWRWCVSGWWKLCVPHPAHEPKAAPELYDLKTDPHEKADLAEEHPDKVRELQALLDQWWKPT